MDPESLARLWCRVLDFEVIDRESGSVEIGPARSRVRRLQPKIVFNPTADPRPPKLRIHLGVNPVGTTQEEELARLSELGARDGAMGQTGEGSWYVLLDPEGNEFFLLRAPQSDWGARFLRLRFGYLSTPSVAQ